MQDFFWRPYRQASCWAGRGGGAGVYMGRLSKSWKEGASLSRLLSQLDHLGHLKWASELVKSPVQILGVLLSSAEGCMAWPQPPKRGRCEGEWLGEPSTPTRPLAGRECPLPLPVSSPCGPTDPAVWPCPEPRGLDSPVLRSPDRCFLAGFFVGWRQSGPL